MSDVDGDTSQEIDRLTEELGAINQEDIKQNFLLLWLAEKTSGMTSYNAASCVLKTTSLLKSKGLLSQQCCDAVQRVYIPPPPGQPTIPIVPPAWTRSIVPLAHLQHYGMPPPTGAVPMAQPMAPHSGADSFDTSVGESNRNPVCIDLPPCTAVSNTASLGSPAGIPPTAARADPDPSDGKPASAPRLSDGTFEAETAPPAKRSKKQREDDLGDLVRVDMGPNNWHNAFLVESDDAVVYDDHGIQQTLVQWEWGGVRVHVPSSNIETMNKNTGRATRSGYTTGKAAGREVQERANCGPAAASATEVAADIAQIPKSRGRPLYSLVEFKNVLWKQAEKNMGHTIEDIEAGRLVRGANSRVENGDSSRQVKAQYGRILPDATDRLFRSVLDLSQSEVFVDIGHGIGNTVLQAAYTIGCDSHGIEVVAARQLVARLIASEFEGIKKKHGVHNRRQTKVGEVFLKHGRLEVVENRNFLINPGRVTKALCNNFNGVFRDRSSSFAPGQGYYLDDFVAGLFALMEPGSMLVTLQPLDLGPACSQTQRQRERHGLDPGGLNASFYEMEEVEIGKAKDTVSWSQNGGKDDEITVYKYTRLEQGTKYMPSVFLCCNKDCDKAQSGTPIPAAKIVTDGDSAGPKVVINHCDCKYTKKSLRPRQKVNYY